MATPNLSEIVTTTLYNRSKKIADNVTENNALLSKLQMKGRAKPISGGREIILELSHAENQTYKRYSGYELLNIAPSETLSAAVYPWKQAAVAVTISGLEQLQNSGKEKMIDLLDARIEVAEATFKNNLSNDIYSDGTASGGKQITGLQAQVSTSPSTGTVGGIPAANYTFWRNQVQPGSGTTTLTDANIEGAMRALWLKTTRNNDMTDLITADNEAYGHFWASMTERQRFTGSTGKMAKAGWNSMMFNSAEVVLDGGIGGSSPGHRMYFLNTDYLKWCPHRDKNMTPLDSGRHSTDQDALVKLILWAGNLCASNRRLQGVLNGA